jgi:hypothetical protein
MAIQVNPNQRSQGGVTYPATTASGQPTTYSTTQGTAAQPTSAPAATKGAPVASASTATTANPLQPSYIPTPPQGQATTYQAATTGAATYDPATIANTALYNNSYNPQTATSELNSAAGVQDQQQNQNLMAMLAAQGISPGSSAAQAAAQNLGNQQVSALAPSLVSAQQYGAGLSEQSGLANQGALNSTNQFNASSQNSAGQFNAGSQNTANLANQSALNSAGQYNASANNSMTDQNLQNYLQAQQFDASAANSSGSQQSAQQNTDWLAQLQAQLGLQGQGLSTVGSLAGDQANQTVPVDQSLFSSVMQPLESGASAYATAAG